MAVAVAAERRLPRPAVAFIALVAAGGALAVVAQLAAHAGSFGPRDVLALAGVAAAVTVADQFTLTLPHGGEMEHFSLTDAVWATALLVTVPGVPTVGAAAGTVAWQLGRRWPWHKVAFNAGLVALGLSVAEAVYGLPAERLSADDPVAWALGAVALACCFLVNTAGVALVIALVQHEPFARILLDPWRVNVTHWLGNVSVGLLAAIVWEASPLGIVLVVLPLGLLFLAYRGWLASTIERDQMEQMARAADAVAREGDLSARLPVGERGERLPALAATLNRMLDQLERAFRRERHFMRQASEALRAPTAEIGELLRGLGDEPAAGDVVLTREAVEDELARTERILDDLVALAGAGQPGFVRPADLDARSFLDDVAERARPLLGDRLAVAPPADGAVVHVDSERLGHALANLLQNAAVHADGGGPVLLRLAEDDGSHRFEVVDDGPGVPAGHEEAIFEPFHRASGAGPGSGLGLALARTVAEAHGGTAGVDNRPGLGMTVWLRVPR